MGTVFLVLGAGLVGALILVVGISTLRSFSPKPGEGHHDVEDVEDLEVFFVCGECGTEFRVTRLGELQVPRHCGERMRVVRRPGSTV